MIARNLCEKHYRRLRRTGDPTKVKRVVHSPICLTQDCGESTTRGGHGLCKFCYHVQYKQTYPNQGVVTRRASRKYHLKTKYGLTPEDEARLITKQKNRCAICRGKNPGPKPGQNWCIDHDHVTGQVRGLLCHWCNAAIGLLKDDPGLIATAAAYVQRHRQMVLY